MTDLGNEVIEWRTKGEIGAWKYLPLLLFLLSSSSLEIEFRKRVILLLELCFWNDD